VSINARAKVRQTALGKAQRLAAARAVVEKLTDEECQILYVEIEARIGVQLEEIDTPAPSELSYKEAKHLAIIAFERDYLARVMVLSKGSVSKAARVAGVDRTNFRRLLQRIDLRPRLSKGQKTKLALKHTDRIREILDENRQGLRTYEIAAKTRQAVPNTFSLLKFLERQGHVKRHGQRFDTLWTLAGIEPVRRVETISAAIVDLLSQLRGPIDNRVLRDEVRNVLFRNVGKKLTEGSLVSGIHRLIKRGLIAPHGANEHGPMYILTSKGGAAASDLN
jgi:DNA-binding protein Fis